MSIGVLLVASGVGRVLGMCVAGRLLVMALEAEAFTSVTYVFVVHGGRLSVVMYFSHEVYMVVSSGVVALGIFLSSVVAGRSRVALRVSKEARMEGLRPGLSPLDTLVMMTLVGWMWSV